MLTASIKPLISVAIVTYNHEKYIAKALDSVLAQRGLFAIEIIVGEDASPDDTFAVLEKYKSEHPNIVKVLRGSENIGALKNMIRVLKACTGDYIAILDGDDYWTNENKLQKQLNFLQLQPEFSGCFHNTQIVSELGEFFRLFIKDAITAEISQRDLVSRKTSAFGHTSSLFFRSECLSSLPTYFLTAPYDRTLAFLVAENGKWGGMADVMSAYRINEGGIYNSIGEIKQALTMVAIFEAIASDKNNRSRYTTELNERLSYYHHRLMQLYKAQNNKSKYLKHLIKYVSFKEKNLSLLKVLIKEELLA